MTMSMGNIRFFVANLNSKTTENDLKSLFEDYGSVKNIDLKIKENLVDSEYEKIIAFVTVNINAADAEYCASELSCRKLNGSKIKVSLAKESFLDRLKREREEANQDKSALQKTTNYRSINATQLIPENLKNKRKIFSDDVDLRDDDIAPELLMTKKRASSSLHNGRIVIENFDKIPVHVIESKKSKLSKPKDSETSTADQKRKKSLLKMQNIYKQKNSVIQQALTNSDNINTNKIIFSDDEEDEDEKVSIAKTNIFCSDDDEADEDQINAELEKKFNQFGKKGEKLVQMQSHQSIDPRFKIDAKFLDDDDDHEDGDGVANGDGNPEENERDWQLGILEQVVGKQLDKRNVAQKASANRKMIRFDPGNENHQKLLHSKNETTQKPDIETQTQTQSYQKVSKEVFYIVTDSLAESLKTRGDGFSLLNMFAKSKDLELRDDQLKKVTNQKIIVNKTERKGALDPFVFDDENNTDDESNHENTVVNDYDEKKHSNKYKPPILIEPFFFCKNDERLKEGASFFHMEKKAGAEEDYEQVKKRLKLLIKTKIAKSQKQKFGGKALSARKKQMKKF